MSSLRRRLASQGCVQVEAVAGRTLDDPAFFEETLRSLQALILDGVRPR